MRSKTAVTEVTMAAMAPFFVSDIMAKWGWVKTYYLSILVG